MNNEINNNQSHSTKSPCGGFRGLILLLFLFSTTLSYAFPFWRNRTAQVEELTNQYYDKEEYDEYEYPYYEYDFPYEIFSEMDYRRAEIFLALDTVDIDVPQEFMRRLDYLATMWLVQQAEMPDCFIEPNFVNVVSDSIYIARLQSLPHVIEMSFNSHVRSMIELYTVRRPRQVSQMLALSRHYFPIFEEALERHGLPLELRYLPVIESALNNRAVSHMGAAGLWQFMPATGRAYGLEINSLIDERLDPVKSSDAAARYLRALYRIYGDWNLVLAAYNTGMGNVNRAIRRSGGRRDYWEIHPFLARETRSFVPIFIAANYAMNFAHKHNICPAIIDRPVAIDTVVVNERIHFEQIASVLDIPIEMLRTLNPQYRRDIIPGDLRPFVLRLPFAYTMAFIEQRESVLAYRADELVHNRRAEVEAARASTAAGGTGTIHVVRSGETLGHIARQHGTTAARIAQLNGITTRTIIRPGQRLRVR